MARSPWLGRERRSLILRFALWCANRSEGPLRALGVVPRQFRELLRMRLALDLSGGEGRERASLAIVLAFVWLAGLLPGVAALFVHDPFAWALIEFSITTFLLGMVMLLQLGNVLLDGTDLHVIGPLPVPERTLYAARFGHALLYVGMVAGCLHFWPVLLSGIGVAPWAPVALCLVAVPSTVFVVAAVALLYAVLLRAFGAERFQRVTLWAQIAAAAFAMGGYQLLRHVVDFREVTVLFEHYPALLGTLPPVWFAGAFAALVGDASARNLLLAGATLAAPALAAFLAFRLASRGLVAALTAVPESRGRRGSWRATSTSLLGSWITRTRTERAGFDWALVLSRREPAYLRSAYAQVIGFTMMALTMALTFARGGELEAVPYAMYMVPLLVPTVLELGTRTEHPEAIRHLRALPIDAPGHFHVGAVKALLAGTVGPPFAVLGCLCVAGAVMGGPRTLASAAVAILASVWLGLATTRRMGVALPFSVKARHGSANSANFGVTMAVLLAIVVCVLLQIAITMLVPLLLPATAVGLFLLVRREARALGASLSARAERQDDTLAAEVA